MATIKIIAGVLVCCFLLLMVIVGTLITFEVVKVVLRELKSDREKR